MDIIDQLTELLPISYPFILLRVEREEALREVHLYLEISAAHPIPDGYSLHSHYSRTWEHLKLFEYRCFMHCNLPVYRDRKTKSLKKAEVSFSRDYSRFTLQYEHEVMRLMSIHHCFQTVARNLGIATQRVEHLYHHYTHSLDSMPMSYAPTRIGCDETSSRKGHEYVTTFIDMDTHQVIGVYEGRSSQCFEAFFHDHPNPEAVREISIDMSPAFIKGAELYFPQASITYDKWHVIKRLYEHLESMGRKAYGLMDRLQTVIRRIEDFYSADNPQQAKAILIFIADFAQEYLGNNPLSKMIRRSLDRIVQQLESKVNNGLLEGINSKIQVIKRIARGFRYKTNFMKMIRFVFYKPELQVNS